MALSPVVLSDYVVPSQEDAGEERFECTRLAAPEVLRLEDIRRPAAGAGPGAGPRRGHRRQLHRDLPAHRALQGRRRPSRPGTEAAGTVEAVGPGVTTVRPGDRVGSVNVLGAYAEYALAPAERLVPLPDGVTTRQAAAVLLQGMTAHYLTTSTFPLSRGQTCLVHAAAGGVGLLLCQMAKRRGARVIGTVSTEEKAALAREAGADEVILYTQADFETETKRLTAGAGVHVVYDSVGRTTFAKGLNCIARRGMMVLFGQSSGPVDPIDPQVLNQKGSLFLTRPDAWAHYTAIARRAARAGRRRAALGGRRLARGPDRRRVPAGAGRRGAPRARRPPHDGQGAADPVSAAAAGAGLDRLAGRAAGAARAPRGGRLDVSAHQRPRPGRRVRRGAHSRRRLLRSGRHQRHGLRPAAHAAARPTPSRGG